MPSPSPTPDVSESPALSLRISDAVFRVIDLETTGLDPSEAGICEVAWEDVDCRGNSIGLAPHQCLIDPGVPIPPEASAVHHIVEEDVVGARRFSEVLPRIEAEVPADFVGDESDRPVVYVAHNAEFEQSFMPSLAPWLCTYRLALHLFPKLPSHGLQYLRYAIPLAVNLPRTQAVHRAGADVAVTVPLLTVCLQALAGLEKPPQTIGELIRFAEAPALLDRVPFKSSNYIRFEDAEYSLLEWIVERHAGGRDCVHTAAHHLEIRDGRDREIFGF